MTTLIFFIIFFGFYLFYNTSKKAVLNQSNVLEIWAQNHQQVSKYIGAVLFLVAFILSLYFYGVGSGIFSFFVMLMTVGSLIIMLCPLKYVTYKTVSAAFFLSIFLELF